MEIRRHSWNLGDKLKKRCECKNPYSAWFYMIMLSTTALNQCRPFLLPYKVLKESTDPYYFT